MVFLLGLMVGYIKENIKRIKKMEKENLYGMMEKYIKEIGKMENKMEKVNFFFLLQIFGKKVSGKMEKELDGLIKIFLYK